MKTPQRITVHEFAMQLSECVRRSTTRPKLIPLWSFHHLACHLCNAKLSTATAHISIHDARFPNCVGDGQVFMTEIIFCYRCEPPPEPYGCLHV